MIEGVIVLLTGIHCLVFIYLIFFFQKLGRPKSNNEIKAFSIIIPTRNEEETLSSLLHSLALLDYPETHYEVILIDDSSDDKTLEIAHEFNALKNFRISKLSKDKIGKKAAIELGVSLAKNEIILTTDSDCTVQSSWLKAYNSSFSEGIHMVVGPVKMTGTGLFVALQSFDFGILVGYAASLIGMGKPSTSNGANLAYRRDTFLEVSGYQGNHEVPSGDDEFLLLKIVKKYPMGIVFLKDSNAVVSTPAKTTFAELLNQRVRWVSKWSIHGNFRIVLSVVAVFIDNLAMIGLFTGLIFSWLSLWFLLLVLARIIVKGIYVWRINYMLKGQISWLTTLVYELTYPFFILILGATSIFGQYTWKGRKYN